jgi:hypothetical protein
MSVFARGFGSRGGCLRILSETQVLDRSDRERLSCHLHHLQPNLGEGS